MLRVGGRVTSALVWVSTKLNPAGKPSRVIKKCPKIKGAQAEARRRLTRKDLKEKT